MSLELNFTTGDVTLLQSLKKIESNGIHYPDPGYHGFKKVEVSTSTLSLDNILSTYSVLNTDLFLIEYAIKASVGKKIIAETSIVTLFNYEDIINYTLNTISETKNFSANIVQSLLDYSDLIENNNYNFITKIESPIFEENIIKTNLEFSDLLNYNLIITLGNNYSSLVNLKTYFSYNDIIKYTITSVFEVKVAPYRV